MRIGARSDHAVLIYMQMAEPLGWIWPVLGLSPLFLS